MTENAVVSKKQELSITEFFEQAKARIASALPRHMTPERMIRIALTEVRKSPKLAMCDRVSLIGCIMECSLLGLEPGSALGHAYLIPYKNGKRSKDLGHDVYEAQFIAGYKGLIDLARRSGQIVSISARCVYENDQFDFAYGLNERLDHKPFTGGSRGAMTYVYAVAKLKDGGHQMEVMSLKEVEAVRDGLRVPNPVWKTHFDEMARKTAIRRIAKYLPLSPEMASIFERDDSIENGVAFSAVDSAKQLGVVDADYIPQPNLSDDAATIKDINAEAEKAAADDRIADLRQKVDDAADAAQQPRPDTSKMNEQQLVALLTAIRSPA